jgi:predicted permease
MNWLREWRRRLRVLFRGGNVSAELEEEMRFHLEMQAEENRESGMEAEEARYAARRRFGSTVLLAEEARDAWGWRAIEGALRNIKHSARILRRTPGFTAATVLTLALGIGANTAIFSLTHALLLRSLPVPHPEHLRVLSYTTQQGERMMFSNAAVAELAEAKSIAAIAAYGTPGPVKVSRSGGALEDLHREQASSVYFSALGVYPAAGRLFSSEEDRAPSGAVVISHAYWKRRFNSNPGVVGSRVEINRRPLTIIGVAPEHFSGFTPERAVDLWFPIGDGPARCLDDPGCEMFKVLVRLRPGIRDGQALAELSGIFGQHLRARALSLPEAVRSRLIERQLVLSSGGAGDSFLGRTYRKPLLILAALVGLLLLLACANIGNMLLARAAARSREMAIRLAIGAGRGHLLRQMLAESLVLALAGGAVALPLAWWAAEAMVRAYIDPKVHLSIDVAPDLGVLAFTAAVSVCASLIFGLLPALRATRADLWPALKGANVLALRARGATLGKVLAGWQVALSIMLLAGAGLFVRTLVNLKTLDAGYKRERVVTFSVGTPEGYGIGADAAMWRLLDKVRHLPGVLAASAASPAPPAGGPLFKIKVEGYQPRPGEDPDVRIIDVADGFFETVRTPLLRGRMLEPADRGRKPNVALVNEAFVRQFFGRRNPVGKSIAVGSNYGGGNVLVQTEIIGVVADARYSHPKEPPFPTVFPLSPYLWSSGFVVRTAQDPGAFIGSLPQIVRRAEPSLRLLDASTMSLSMDLMLTRERMLADLSGFFGILAILLASLGIYGVMAYGVRQRTPEIGIRIAMGAHRGAIVRMVLKETLVPLVGGLAIGIPATLIGSRVLTSMLFGLKPADPVTVIAAIGVLSAVALAAGYLPARQAARIEPTRALRVE